jgi:DNA processing protein
LNTLTEIQEEKIYKIALGLIPKIGNKTALDLVEHYGSAKAVFEKGKEKDLCQFQKINSETASVILQKTTLTRAEEELVFTEKNSIQILSQDMMEYPKRMKNCFDAPFLLYYKGNANLNASKIVSIVGTRKPTASGRIFCERLVQELKAYNVLIVSGLAYGIDVTAHIKSCDIGLENIGVVAHGLDKMYPYRHRQIADRMLDCGGILSEFPSTTEAKPQHFPMRNRIIAGLSDAVVVVETAIRGGSMITAKMANDYSKDVFAVPGRLDDALSKGCNHLIKTHKASLIENAADIAYHLRWKKQKAGSQKQLFTQLTEQEKQVVDFLVGEDGVHLDELIHGTKISTSRIASLLLELELKGMVRALPGNSFRLL